MKELVWFLIVFICTEFVFCIPQNLQDQFRIQLDPINQPESEFLHKDQGKRTIFPTKHYLYGKHVAIDSHGHKFLLGYSPLNVRYPPFLKPVGIFKPTFHHNNIVPWRPLKQYLPPAVSVPNPVQFSDNGWKPILSPSILTLSKPSLEHLKPWDGGLNHAAQPIHPFQHMHPAQPVQPIHFPSINHVHPIHQVHPVHSIQPVHQPVHSVQPVHHDIPDNHVKPLLHNYYYFQTPVSKPVFLPQQPLFEVARPQLPVLPLGAAFPAPVAQPPQFPVVSPPEPIVLHPRPEIPFVHDHHHHGPLFTPSHQLPPHQAVPLPDVNPIIHQHLPEQPQPLPIPPSLSVPVSFPPLTVEFHGNHQLNPFNLHPSPINNTHLFTNLNSPPILYGRHPHQVQFPVNNNEYLPPITHLHPINNQPIHHLQEQPQVLFNPAIRPGHQDLHIPDHLPNHPQFTSINEHNLLPPYHNMLKPSISLEPPFMPLHT